MFGHEKTMLLWLVISYDGHRIGEIKDMMS